MSENAEELKHVDEDVGLDQAKEEFYPKDHVVSVLNRIDELSWCDLIILAPIFVNALIRPSEVSFLIHFVFVFLKVIYIKPSPLFDRFIILKKQVIFQQPVLTHT